MILLTINGCMLLSYIRRFRRDGDDDDDAKEQNIVKWKQKLDRSQLKIYRIFCAFLDLLIILIIYDFEHG